MSNIQGAVCLGFVELHKKLTKQQLCLLIVKYFPHLGPFSTLCKKNRAEVERLAKQAMKDTKRFEYACEGFPESKGGLNKDEFCHLLGFTFPHLIKRYGGITKFCKLSRDELNRISQTLVDTPSNMQQSQTTQAPSGTQIPPAFRPSAGTQPKTGLKLVSVATFPNVPAKTQTRPKRFNPDEDRSRFNPGNKDLQTILREVPISQRILREKNVDKLFKLCSEDEFEKLCRSDLMEPIWKEKISRECGIPLDFSQMSLAQLNRRYGQGKKFKNFFEFYIVCHNIREARKRYE